MFKLEIKDYIEGSLRRFVKSFPQGAQIDILDLRHHLIFDVNGRFPEAKADEIVDGYLSDLIRGEVKRIYINSLP
jgi:hypothetical protein